MPGLDQGSLDQGSKSMPRQGFEVPDFDEYGYIVDKNTLVGEGY